MKPVKIEFKPKYVTPNWVWLVFSIIGMIVCVVEGWSAIKAYRVLQTQRDVHARAVYEATRSALLQAQSLDKANSPQPYYQDAMAVKREAEMPIGQVFASIENTRIAGVRLRSLQINATDHTAKIEVESMNSGLLIDYISEINSGYESPKWIANSIKFSTVADINSNEETLYSDW